MSINSFSNRIKGLFVNLLWKDIPHSDYIVAVGKFSLGGVFC